MEKNPPFNRVALMTRPGKQVVPPTLTALYQYLKAIGVLVVVEKNTAAVMKTSGEIKDLESIDQTEFANHADLIIVVGGDGSFIQAAHVATKSNLPILGINRGRLGFLTDIYPHELDTLCAVLQGQYQSEKRFLLSADIDGAPEQLALNEVVLLPGDVAHMIDFDIFIDGHYVCNQRADGLIISTPTGSTAYALSGGGPILHPNLDALLLLPMFPHILSNRPIVVDAKSQLRIAINPGTATPFVSCDGQTRSALPAGTELKVKRHDKTITLIHPENYQYYDTLREKLGWQIRTQTAMS